MRTVIVYGSSYGDTADAAERIADSLERLTAVRPDLAEIARTPLSRLESYEVVLVGCSTWDVGELQADWQETLPELECLDLSETLVGFFGSGDQLGYPDTFQDALGILAEVFETRGATIVGYWPASGYEFDDSLALRGENFVGLALDYTCQIELNEARISEWTACLVDEIASFERSLHPPVPR